MNVHRTRRMLWLVSALLAVASLVVPAAAWWMPTEAATAADERAAATPPAGSCSAQRFAEQRRRGFTVSAMEAPGPHETPPLADYAVIWRRALRRPLVDPRPVAPPPGPRRTLPLRLVGTVVEGSGQNSYAILAASGRTLLRRVGDVAEEVEIVAIADGTVTVLFDGEPRTLRAEKEGNKR